MFGTVVVTMHASRRPQRITDATAPRHPPQSPNQHGAILRTSGLRTKLSPVTPCSAAVARTIACSAARRGASYTRATDSNSWSFF